jgi:hypothetical protein
MVNDTETKTFIRILHENYELTVDSKNSTVNDIVQCSFLLVSKLKIVGRQV